MKKNIAVLAGDGIGPEVMIQAIRVLKEIEKKYQHHFNFTEAKIGGAAFDEYQNHCPQETIDVCKQSDAILFGSVGGPVDAQLEPKWKNCEANSLLAIRKHFGFNINIRPVRMYSELSDHSPLKQSVIGDNTDIVIFRELIGDIYFGEHKQGTDKNGIRYAKDTADYNEEQIKSILHAAFQAAKNRDKKVTSVDKA
ncbi:isocitrate/isopropylmalate family dehydrogenase, partial [Francisellaceae bacterium]|nr:isocitrate/isopropylmalate family dehydrogenase [Francisellaceae bacterium]